MLAMGQAINSKRELTQPLVRSDLTTPTPTPQLLTHPTAWSYDESQDWGMLSPDFELCQVGTQQAPIPLNFQQGLSTSHLPILNYSSTVEGSYYNWGYGPAFSLSKAQCTSGSTAADCPVDFDAPNFTFDDNGINETVYLVSWHVHTPADHSVQNDRSKAELHLVHVDKNGSERAVLAIRIDPGILSYSNFFGQAPFLSSNDTGMAMGGEQATTLPVESRFPNFNSLDTRINGTSTPAVALQEVGDFREMWTYRGSLTSPPCREGIRFFVARQIMFVSNPQMQDILRISTYSARAEQEVWMHEINV
jgi:carbonic anhydrase